MYVDMCGFGVSWCCGLAVTRSESSFCLQDYPKLSQSYYVLLECLCQDHMAFLSSMEPQVFLYMFASISEGLQALGGNLNYFTGTAGLPVGATRRRRVPGRSGTWHRLQRPPLRCTSLFGLFVPAASSIAALRIILRL